MKVIEKDPRVKFQNPEKRVREILEAVETSDAVQQLNGEGKNVKMEELYKAAVKVLKDIHDKKMAGRLAQWVTTCRLDGCDKQPRKGRRPVATKNRRRTFVFCPGHAGIRNLVAKADYQRLKSNVNLRVVA